jgi:hypothetical protein
MNIVFKSLPALEAIKNGSICIKTKDGIKNTSYYNYGIEDFVLVQNVPHLMLGTWLSDFTIHAGEQCRYLKVDIRPKSSILDLGLW